MVLYAVPADVAAKWSQSFWWLQKDNNLVFISQQAHITGVYGRYHFPVWFLGLDYKHWICYLSPLFTYYTPRARHLSHGIRGDWKGPTVHVHTNSSHLGQCVLCMSLVLPPLHTFKYIFGTIWPILCWQTVKPTKSNVLFTQPQRQTVSLYLSQNVLLEYLSL